MYRRFMVAVALLGMGAAMAVTAPASAVNAPHGVVVSANPVDGTPHVLDGRVYAIARVGSKVVLGGTFTTARNHNNQTVQNRPSILSYDYATNQIDLAFAPQLNGTVNAVAADPSNNAVFVGGTFTTVNGVANRGLVKLNLADGQITPGFKAVTTGAVNDLLVRNQTLYVGGVFAKIKGTARPGLAAVSTSTGAVDANFNVPVTTPMFKGTAGVKKLDVSPDGTKMVIIGNFASVGGQARTQMAMLDLAGTATVSSWQTSLYGNVCSSVFDTYMRDVDISPDGTYAAVVTTGGPGNGTAGLCDSTARWDLDRTGSAQTPYWADWTGGDTLLSVAVTNSAVYVGGHQRWLNNAGGRDSARPSAVSREGIGAIDPQSGVPLSWNPGRTRGYGATALVATPEGLLVGSDTESLGGEFHGRIGMFPVAGGSAPKVAKATTSPTNLYVAETDGDLMRTAFNTTPSGTAIEVSGPGTDSQNWSSINGGFMANGVLYTVNSNGSISSRTYDGNSGFGAATAVSSWLSLSNVTSLGYSKGFLYYTKSNDSRLYRRSVTLDGMLIAPLEYTVSGSGDGLDWRNVIGLTVVDGKLLASYSNGNLTSTVLTRNVPVASTRTTVSGPGIDGRNWTGRDLFAFGPA
jgi:hypothetical protein